MDYLKDTQMTEEEVKIRESSPMPEIALEYKLRDAILKAEELIMCTPGATYGDRCPLVHTFVDGAYVRKITMPKGLLLTSKIHKICHPYFIMKGDVSVLTEEGTKRIKAPYAGVTPAGTKRLIYVHEETEWITVHVTKETDLGKIEDEIISKDYAELDNKTIIDFITEVKQEDENVQIS